MIGCNDFLLLIIIIDNDETKCGKWNARVGFVFVADVGKILSASRRAVISLYLIYARGCLWVISDYLLEHDP